MSDLVEAHPGAIPKTWAIKPLADITTKIQDGTHFSPKTEEGPCRYVTSKNIRCGRLDLNDCEWISQREHDAIFARCDVRFGDVLLTKDGANTGNACLNDQIEPFSLLSSVAVLRTDGVLNHSGFILQYLLSPTGQRRLKDLMSGNAIPRLTLRKIKAFTAPVPPPAQQRRIAEILGTVDEVIEQTEALIAKQQQVKAGLMHDLFTRGVTATGTLRPPPAEAPHLYQPSPLGPIPKEWEVSKIRDVGVVKGGKRVPAGTPFASLPTQFPYLRVTDMVDGWIDDSSLEFVDAATERVISNYKIFRSDIYVTIAGTLGQFGRIPEHLSGAQLTENAARITEIDQKRVDLDYLCSILRSDLMKEQKFAGIGAGAGVPKLALYQIERFEVPLPSLDEQLRIQAPLTNIQDAIQTETAHLAKLRQEKQGLMQDLLTGRVPVPI